MSRRNSRRSEQISDRKERSGRNHGPDEWEEFVSYIRSPLFQQDVEWIAGCRGEHTFGAPRKHHDAIWAVAWWLKDGRSADEVIAFFRQADTWHVILRELRKVFPGDHLLFRDAPIPSRDIFRHMNNRINSDDIKEFEEMLFNNAIKFAKQMGLGENESTWLEPSRGAALSGDLLQIRAMSSFEPGVKAYNPRTGKFQYRRHSRSAHLHIAGDRREMFGHSFAHLSARTGNSLEEITFSILPVGKTLKAINGESDPHSESRVALDLAERIQLAVAGGFAMLHYDAAIRGKDVERAWQLGLHPLINIHDKTGKTTERIPLGEYKLKNYGRSIKVTAWQGAVCITGTDGRLIKLDAASIYDVARKKSRSVKAIYRIAEGTNCNTEFWGDEFRVPMTSIAGSDLCRAEHLRPLAPGGDKWMSMYGRRNSAESLNSLITGGLLKGERARSNEPSRVWLDALRLIHRKNYRAYMVYCRRRGVDPGPSLAA